MIFVSIQDCVTMGIMISTAQVIHKKVNSTSLFEFTWTTMRATSTRLTSPLQGAQRTAMKPRKVDFIQCYEKWKQKNDGGGVPGSESLHCPAWVSEVRPELFQFFPQRLKPCARPWTVVCACRRRLHRRRHSPTSNNRERSCKGNAANDWDFPIIKNLRSQNL